MLYSELKIKVIFMKGKVPRDENLIEGLEKSDQYFFKIGDSFYFFLGGGGRKVNKINSACFFEITY